MPDLTPEQIAEGLARRLAEALRLLEHRDEPGRFCDHAAAPCDRCSRAKELLDEARAAGLLTEGEGR